MLTGATTLWKTRNVDEETWTMLGQSNWNRNGEAKM